MLSAAASRARRANRSWLAPVGLALLGLGLRLGYWLGFTAGRTLQSDARQYHELATYLAQGKGYVDTYPQVVLHPTGFRPPLYPGLLSALYTVFWPSPGFGRGLNVVLGVLTVVLTYFVVKRHASRLAGIVASVFVAASPNLIANDTYTLNEPLALVLLLLLVDAVLRRRYALAGLLTGALVLTRPSAQLLVIAVGAWVVFTVGWRKAGIYVAMTALVVVPWIGRNWAQLGSPVLVTSNGFNWSATYAPAAQEADDFVDPITVPPPGADRFLQFNELKWDRYLTKAGQENLRHHPTLLPHVMFRNFKQFLELTPGRNTFAERSDGRSMGVRNATLPLFYVVAVLGVAGLVVARRRRLALLVALVGVYFTLASMAFVSPPRLRSPVDLAFAVGVGLLVDEVARRRRAARTAPERPLARAGA